MKKLFYDQKDVDEMLENKERVMCVIIGIAVGFGSLYILDTILGVMLLAGLK